jgi:alkanesulfonate monooxygenase SsuD/methylene tetrahydromethanopterin reductase-like flavin-dependent oxidoreductase (luciferase family)
MDIDIILEPDLTPDEIRDLAVAAEGYGIRTLWASNYSSSRDAFMSLVPAALATRTIGLGVLVVSPWEMHPLKMANALLTLNEYSRGRASLVVSAGGEWCGVIGSDHARRVRAARETLEIIRAAASGRTVNYKGELYVARGYKATWPKGPAPRLYAGASKPQMLRMGARSADGVMMSDVTIHYLKDMVDIAVGERRKQGLSLDDFRVSNFWAWHVKQDRAVSMKEARRELILRGWLVRYHLAPFLTLEECDLVEKHKNAFLQAWVDRSGEIKGVDPALVDKLIENFSFAGDLSDLDRHLERLRGFAGAGLTEVALRLHDDQMDALRLIGERVMPAFAE